MPSPREWVRGENDAFDVLPSTIGGYGCFAIRPIARAALIWRFGGQIFTGRQTFGRLQDGLLRSCDDPLQVDDDLFMSLESPAVFFNHGCEPNAFIRSPSDLVALRDIAAGEEILFDYALTVPAANVWTMRAGCRCAAPRCRQRIGSWLTVERAVVDRHVRHGTIQEFIARDSAQRALVARVRRWLHRKVGLDNGKP